MKPIETLTINYFDKGKEKTKSFTINFVSNKILRDYNSIMLDSSNVKNSWNRIQDILTDSAFLKVNKSNGWQDKIKKNDEEYKNLVSDVYEVGKSDFFKRRFEIITTLLKDNGHENDTEAMCYEFWDEKVPPDQIVRSLTKVIYKDLLVGSKKKT